MPNKDPFCPGKHCIAVILTKEKTANLLILSPPLFGPVKYFDWAVQSTKTRCVLNVQYFENWKPPTKIKR